MMSTFILTGVSVPRRTIHISERTEECVRELAEEGESFSAAASRLIDAGAAALRGHRPPSFVGVADGPSEELGRRAEEILAELAREDRS
jgi:hypothetical protein